MARRRTPYKTNEGKVCPSVTTILSKFKDPGALMYWSWNIAYTPLQEACHILEQLQKVPTTKTARVQARKFLKGNPLEEGNFRSASGKEATAGTFAHDLVEMWILGNKSVRLSLSRKTANQLASIYNYPVDIATKAHSSFQSFVDWAHQWHLTVVATETKLVCNEFRYGGTLDCVAMVSARKRRQRCCLLDWKTSNAVYADYLCQVAAYGRMWDENFPDQPIECYNLVRFDKETGDYHHHQWTEVEEALQMFLKLRECYELLKVVEKRVK